MNTSCLETSIITMISPSEDPMVKICVVVFFVLVLAENKVGEML